MCGQGLVLDWMLALSLGGIPGAHSSNLGALFCILNRLQKEAEHSEPTAAHLRSAGRGIWRKREHMNMGTPLLGALQSNLLTQMRHF